LHVYFGAKDAGAVGEEALAHRAKEFEAFGGTAGSIRRIGSRFGEVTTVGSDFVY